MNSLLLRFVLGASLVFAIAHTATAAVFELITATDPSAEYTVANGVITSLESGGGGADAVVLPGTSLGSGNSLHIEMQLDAGGETAFTFGTGFEPTGGNELIIMDGVGTPLIIADLVAISVTGQSLIPGTAGSTLTSVTLGSANLFDTHLVLTGGTEAANFGGIGAEGELSVFLNAPSVDWGFGTVFDEDFTAQMNVQVQFHTPEPGTALLVGLPLAGLAWWRRRALSEH